METGYLAVENEASKESRMLTRLDDAICHVLSHPNANLTEDNYNNLVRSCTIFLHHPVDADTIHSSMRLLLRLVLVCHIQSDLTTCPL